MDVWNGLLTLYPQSYSIDEAIKTLQEQMLVVDEMDIAGGVLEITGIDYHLLDNRGLNPVRQFSDTVGKRGMVGHG